MKTENIPSELNRDKLEDMYTKMLLIRYLEEKVAYFFTRGMIHGTTHLYIGEEAVAVGAIANLNTDDWITSTHRGHGHTIAKGLDVNLIMAELLGRKTGYCKGKGGSMHISDISMGHLGANGIVGGGLPIATGAGLTVKLRKESKVVICFFGDGASNQGVFHESLNMASIWKLPVIYICENNQYGMSMSQKKSTNIDDVSRRAEAYGIPGKRIDGNDVFEVYKAVKAARAHVGKKGPYLIAAETYRYMGHSKSDANRYRSREEIDAWKKKDPIDNMRKLLEKHDIFTAAELNDFETAARQRIEDAVEYAVNSPEPDTADLPLDVYSD